MPPKRISREVDGHTLSFSNLDKVLYPETGFTKGQVIDYFVGIAPVLLPHLCDRGITMRRFPNGVDAGSFFEKRCPKHRPEWIGTARGPGEGDSIDYCVLDSTAALAWAGNMAAIELHAPMARCVDIESPQTLVFDLDPGEPATITECAQVAEWIRDLLDAVDLAVYPKTSGSKGMQLYVPLNAGSAHTHEHASSFALAVAQVIERNHRDLVLTNMKRDLRPGKVFIDWSQNSRHKTTICVYSLRARPTETVSTPVTWDEVADAAAGAPLSFTAADVLARVAEHGDLFAEVVTREQHLPAPSGS